MPITHPSRDAVNLWIHRFGVLGRDDRWKYSCGSNWPWDWIRLPKERGKCEKTKDLRARYMLEGAEEEQAKCSISLMCSNNSTSDVPPASEVRENLEKERSWKTRELSVT